MNRRLASLLIAGGLSTVIFATGAAAHGGGVGKGYVSTVTALRPVVPDLAVEMLDGNDRLRLENASGKTILIRGYAGEPYIRFSTDGVYENKNSPTSYVEQRPLRPRGRTGHGRRRCSPTLGESLQGRQVRMARPSRAPG